MPRQHGEPRVANQTLKRRPQVPRACFELLEEGSLVETHERQKVKLHVQFHIGQKLQSVLQVTSVVCRARFFLARSSPCTTGICTAFLRDSRGSPSALSRPRSSPHANLLQTTLHLLNFELLASKKESCLKNFDSRPSNFGKGTWVAAL